MLQTRAPLNKQKEELVVAKNELEIQKKEKQDQQKELITLQTYVQSNEFFLLVLFFLLLNL